VLGHELRHEEEIDEANGRDVVVAVTFLVDDVQK
jgi:hypothetical protein